MAASASTPSLLAAKSFGAVTHVGHSCTQTLASWVSQTRRMRRIKLPGFAEPFTIADCVVLTEGQRGAQRLITLLTSAVLEALETAPTLDKTNPASSMTLLAMPSWVTAEQQAQLQHHLLRLLPAQSAAPVLVPGGPLAALQALAQAHLAAQRDGAVQRIVLAAVGSHCEPEQLLAAATASELLQTGQGHGYVAGEAAACVVLAPLRQMRDLPAQHFALHAPFISVPGPRWWSSADPKQAQAPATLLTAALNGAMDKAGMTGVHISHLQSDTDGSDWRTQLETDALNRSVFVDNPTGAQTGLPRWAPADLLGQVGAPMSLLSWMLAAQSHAHDIERVNTVLSWSIDPAGQAGAVVMERSSH